MTNDRHDMDERVELPLEPEVALRALLAVDPADEDAEGDDDEKSSYTED